MGILDKEFGRSGRFRVSLNGGIRLRATETFTNTDRGTDLQPAPVTNRGDDASATRCRSASASRTRISPQKFDVVGEVFGAIPLGAHQNYQPLEALAGVKLYLARNSFLSLGAGRGLVTEQGREPGHRARSSASCSSRTSAIATATASRTTSTSARTTPRTSTASRTRTAAPIPTTIATASPTSTTSARTSPRTRTAFEDEDGCPEGNKNDRDGDGILDDVDKCPDDPEDFDGFQDEDGCPDPDNDQDGILDVDDLCPNDPEDKDGFEDEDGCPDPDNDHDRILDKDDKCPNEPETYNGYQDEDGCPDRGIVERTNTGIVILKPINFEFDKAIITKDSYPILDAVGATMKGNPDIQLIEVQGHTDEQGDDAYNLDLSDRRAKAVVDYLVAHGVDATHLTSQGYGETQPKDPRHTAAAWATNRRVEFVILKRATD